MPRETCQHFPHFGHTHSRSNCVGVSAGKDFLAGRGSPEQAFVKQTSIVGTAGIASIHTSFATHRCMGPTKGRYMPVAAFYQQDRDRYSRDPLDNRQRGPGTRGVSKFGLPALLAGLLLPGLLAIGGALLFGKTCAIWHLHCIMHCTTIWLPLAAQQPEDAECWLVTYAGPLLLSLSLTQLLLSMSLSIAAGSIGIALAVVGGALGVAVFLPVALVVGIPLLVAGALGTLSFVSPPFWQNALGLLACIIVSCNFPFMIPDCRCCCLPS